jgi:hypothetical protein
MILQELRDRALTIYNETVSNMNSNTRIGSLFRDLAQWVNDAFVARESGKGLISSEKESKIPADTTLELNSKLGKGTFAGSASDLKTLIDNQSIRVGNVETSIDNLGDAVGQLSIDVDSKLGKGTYTGTAADLKANIDSEGSVRLEADSLERTQRIAADSALSAAIALKLDKGSFAETADYLAVKGNTTKSLAEVEEMAISADEKAASKLYKGSYTGTAADLKANIDSEGSVRLEADSLERTQRMAADSALSAAIALKLDKGSFAETADYLAVKGDTSKSLAEVEEMAVTADEKAASRLDKGSYQGTASDLKALIDNQSTELTALDSGLDSRIQDLINESVSKPFVVEKEESIAGTYNFQGDQLNIYQRTIKIIDLPTVGNTSAYIISEEPLGYGLFLDVAAISLATGKNLAGKFFPNSYEISSIEVDSQLRTVLHLKCLSTPSTPVSASITLRYLKFNGDVIEFDVALPGTIDKSSVELSIPQLKFNKKMAFSYVTDDSYSIYQFLFAGINKRYVVTDWYNASGNSQFSFHLNGPRNETNAGYTPDKFLQCTDGAGVMRRYATTVSCWPDKLKDQAIGQDVGKFWPWISEKEFKYFYDFGFMLGYHDLIGYNDDTTNTQAAFDKCVADTVALFKSYAGITPKVMVEPNGDHEYIDFSQGNATIQFITAQSGDSRIKKAYPFANGFTLDKKDITIQRIFAYGNDLTWDTTAPVTAAPLPGYAADLLSILAGFNSTADMSSVYWLIGSAHRSGPWELNLITKVHDLYGDEALDNLWFPTLDEMYEYWFMRTNTSSVKTITPNGLHFKMYVPQMPNFHFRDISVLLSGISEMTGISVTSSDNVYGTSSAINDGKLLINLNFDQKLIGRTEKHVSAFEANPTGDYLYDNAAYFVQQLKPGLKEPFQARLDALAAPPSISGFSVNGGASSTNTRNVTLSITYTGTLPTHYMASENPSFSGAEWLSWTANPEFVLSAGYETKTVYVKLKNNFGISGVVNDSIQAIRPALSLTGILINGGAATTGSSQVSVAFVFSGLPDYYALTDGTNTVAWTAFSNPVTFTLSPGYGVKTVSAQLDDGENESAIVTASIEVVDVNTPVLNGISINNGDSFSASGVVTVKPNITNSATLYRIGTDPTLSGSAWLDLTGSTVSFNSGVANGNLTVYFQVSNGAIESGIKSSSITIKPPVVLSSILLSNGDSTLASLTVPVTLTIGTGTPTHYRIGTSGDLSSYGWIPWASNTFNYAAGAVGNFTLYAQVKNEVSASSVVSDSITLTEPPVKVLLAFNNSNNTLTGVVDAKSGETINEFGYTAYTGYSAKQLISSTGSTLPSWLVNLNSSYYAANAVFADAGTNYFSNASNAAQSDTGAPHTLANFLKCFSPNAFTASGTRKMRLSLMLPSGSYKIRFFWSTSSSFNASTEAIRAACHYGIFQGETQLAVSNGAGATGFTALNTTDFHNEMAFTVTDAATPIDVAAWSTVNSYRPGWNLIEITKLS